MNSLLTLLIVSLSFFTLACLAARKADRIGLIDLFWGPSFVLIGIVSAFLGAGIEGATTVALILTFFWASRLSKHISGRTTEDKRYAVMRASWPKPIWLQAYVRVFLLQAIIMLLIAAPLIALGLKGAPISIYTLIGGLLWIAGFAIEARADKELALFKSNSKHKGELLTSGVWSKTRHPNYFGEFTLWMGIAIMALPASPLAFIGPLTLLVIFVFVSIPVTEKGYAGRKGFAAYKKRAWPLFPKIW